jgi:Uri superfamily endonuclease
MKINFHQQKNISHIERFGTPDDNSKAKVEFLKAEMAKLETLIENAGSNNAALKVAAAIHIDYLNESV